MSLLLVHDAAAKSGRWLFWLHDKVDALRIWFDECDAAVESCRLQAPAVERSKPNMNKFDHTSTLAREAGTQRLWLKG